MHELAITESIVAAVTERMRDVPISRVRIEIGALSGIVADAVRFCFGPVTAGTPLEGARLEIDEPPGRMRCRRCGREFDTTDILALCGCGSAELDVLRGRELRIREVEVAG